MPDYMSYRHLQGGTAQLITTCGEHRRIHDGSVDARRSPSTPRDGPRDGRHRRIQRGTGRTGFPSRRPPQNTNRRALPDLRAPGSAPNARDRRGPGRLRSHHPGERAREKDQAPSAWVVGDLGEVMDSGEIAVVALTHEESVKPLVDLFPGATRTP